MSMFSGLKDIVEANCKMAQLSWFNIGGNADYLIRPRSVNELSEVVKICQYENLPIKMLGCGSNLLIKDEGVKGVVIKLEGETFEKTEFNGNKLIAWAGADMGQIVRMCIKKGLAGLEAMAGIPGTLAGAVRMNAGGKFGDIGAAVEAVTLMDCDGNVFEKTKPELSFDYRKVNITAPIILNANIKLYENTTEQLLAAFKEIWIYKKNTQPLSAHNAGCVFKNPKNMNAGTMIDRAGLKGTKIGEAMVSEKHANFIVAGKNCKSKDVIKLIQIVKEKVKEKFNVELELEIEIW